MHFKMQILTCNKNTKFRNHSSCWKSPREPQAKMAVKALVMEHIKDSGSRRTWGRVLPGGGSEDQMPFLS